MDKPTIGVMPTKRIRGANNISEAKSIPHLLIRGWDETFTTPWNTDAHFVTYYPLGAKVGQSWPRCNKTVLPQLADADVDLVTRMLVLDYDRPRHQEWTAESLSAWLRDLDHAVEVSPIVGDWNLLYTTRHGARLVYLLTDPVPVRDAEEHHRWMCVQFRNAGITIDDVDRAGKNGEGKIVANRFPTSDWTRCFRLPFVVRDTEETWNNPHMRFLEQEGVTVDPDSLGRLEGTGSGRADKADIEELDEPQPVLEDAQSLLQFLNPDTGRWNKTDFYKEAKRRLRGRDCYGCIFDHEPLAQFGARHNTMVKFVGEATTLLAGLEDEGGRYVTPDHIYALFLDPVMQLETDVGTPDWSVSLWQVVQWTWAREEAEYRAQLEVEEAKTADSLSALDRIVQGMRTWADGDLLRGLNRAEEDARAYVHGRLILKHKQDHYVMGPDGFYDSTPVARNSLAAHVRHLGMDNVIQIYIPHKKGEGVRVAGGQELFDAHGMIVANTINVPSDRPGSWLEQRADYQVLMRPAYYRRTDLEPVYNSDVDQWLRMLFPVGEFERCCNWIAWALRPEEGPICALSLVADQGAGKGMFVQGMAECFSNQTFAVGRDLVGDFQPGIRNSPILVVDEGWPLKRSGKHPADMFRELVGGGAIQLNMKYTAIQEVWNPIRVLFTANNLDVVSMLCHGRDMSPEDRNALAIRLMHYDIGDRATRYLRQRGGEEHTRGWIKGNGGQPSNWTLAKHFLWIMENRRKPRGNRFLVEGNGDAALMDTMRIRGGSAPTVIEALIRMIEATRKFDGMIKEDGQVLVLTAEILRYWRDYMRGEGAPELTMDGISRVLRAICHKGSGKAERHDKRPAMGRRLWHRVDLRLLQEQAHNDGWKCTALDRLVNLDEETTQ